MSTPIRSRRFHFRQVCALLLAGLCWAESGRAAGSLERARSYFEEARAAHTALQKAPISKRTVDEYARLIEQFRRVYLTAPTYGNSTVSLMAIGELSEEMARRWTEPKHFQQAIEAYTFLLREYPQSQFRFDARLAMARIYRYDLNQRGQALEQYERYLADYPNSAQSKLARQAAVQLRDEIGPAGAPDTTAAVSRQGTLSGKPAAELAVQDKAGRAGAAEMPTAPAAAASTLAAISDVRYWTNPETSRVVVDVSQLGPGEKIKYEVGQLSSPPRIFIDLQETLVPRPRGGRTLEVNGELLKRVRLAQFDKRVSRLVLDLGVDTDYQISELTNPYRLVIDVRGKVSVIDAAIPAAPAQPQTVQAAGQPAAPATAAPEPAPAKPGASEIAAAELADAPTAGKSTPAVNPASAQPQEAVQTADAGTLEPPVPAPPSATESTRSAAPEKSLVADAKPRAAAPIRNGTHSLTRALGLKIGRVFLDAGHGGHDTGTIGPGGLTEKEVALDVAQRIGKLITEKLGSEVVYSREDDSFIPLEQRVQMANQAGADLFLSIHLNSSTAKNATGIETYYLNFTSDPEALKVAARENSGAQETIANLQGIVRKIALQEKLDESQEFATRMQSSLRRTLARGMTRKAANRFDRGVKTAPFVVLIGANMPSILAEVSFLSNPAEEKRLRTSEHRQKLAEALFAGLSSYVESLSGVKIAPKLPTPEPDSTPLRKDARAPARAESAPPAPKKVVPAKQAQPGAEQPEDVALLR